MKIKQLTLFFIILLLLLNIAHNAIALPKEIKADQYMISVKMYLEKDNHEKALEYMEKIVELDVKMPAAFYFKYGKSLLKTGDNVEGKRQIEKYLELEGRKGKYYQEALILFTEAEEGRKEILDRHTVVDNDSGLMWQKEHTKKRRTPHRASVYCKNLIMAGYTDWRLPTKEEADTLRRIYLRNFPIPEAKSNTKASYITSTSGEPKAQPWPNERDSCTVYWALQIYKFSDDDRYSIRVEEETNCTHHDYPFKFSAKCVRSANKEKVRRAEEKAQRAAEKRAAEKARLNEEKKRRKVERRKREEEERKKLEAMGPYIDKNTGLMWERNVRTGLKWQDAISVCESLRTAGYTDWMLPSIDQFNTLGNPRWRNSKSKRMNRMHSTLLAENFIFNKKDRGSSEWTNQSSSSSGYVIVYRFATGKTYHSRKNYRAETRCVRRDK